MNIHAASVLLLLACLEVLPVASPPPDARPSRPLPAQGIVLPVSDGIPGALPPQVSVQTPPMDDGLIAREHLAALSETIGPREAGTLEEAKSAAYIQTVFEEQGYDVGAHSFSFVVEDDDDETSYLSANVMAVKPGLSNREIIVGAHYDSVEVGTGADDNASGVGVMLEVAGKVADIPTPYTIRFIAFGAEEVDLNGSRFYVDQMSESDIENTVGMINLDGLIAGDMAYVYGSDEPAAGILDWILARAQAKDLDLENAPAAELDDPDGTPCDCADYSPFQAAGIPFVFFETNNWTPGEQDGELRVSPEFGENGVIHHTAYDTLEYIDATFPGRVEQHLSLFVALVYDTLTEFEAVDCLLI